jgi:hypothetical protein
MKGFLIVFLLVAMATACGNTSPDNENEEEQVIENVPEVVDVVSDDVEAEEPIESLENILSKLSEEQQNVFTDMLGFIEWYINNRDTLFFKRERIVGATADNVALINLEYLEDYLTFIKKEGKSCISDEFVKKERNFWQSAYNETQEKQIIWEDGPDPWCFEADPVFNGHDWPDDFDEWRESEENYEGKYRSLDPSDIEVIGDTATLYFNSKRKMVKEDGKWKLSGWFAK